MDSTIIKGLRVLEALALASEPQSIAALAKQLGLQKSNMHRTLATLVEAGYVARQGEPSRYTATLKSWEIGAQIIGRHPLRKTAQPFLRRIYQSTGETVYLAVLDGIHVMYLDKLEAMYPLVKSLQPAQRIPALFPASGRAILAHRPDYQEIIERTLQQEPQERALSIENIADEMAAIRSSGYALTNSGWNAGSRSIAAPILDSDGLPLGAIGIAGPIERVTDEAVTRYSVMIRTAAMEIAQM